MQGDSMTPLLTCRVLPPVSPGTAPETSISDVLTGLSAEERLHLLGGLCIGPQSIAAASDLPLQRFQAVVLSAASAPLQSCELWFSAAPCQHGVVGDIRYRCDGQVVFGVVELAEAAFAGQIESETPLQRATEDAYRRIFALLDQLGYPHLWRVWNYLADINGEAGALERYRQFNVGRHQAFAASGRLTSGAVPAACALGSVGSAAGAASSLSIAFLAGRSAPLPLENPRQVAAYDYPADYGPRSPTFARASLARLPGQELLFVSGTASILGHATVHLGDVVAQTRETVANIAAVVDEANRQSTASGAMPWQLGDLVYRAYIRRAEDFRPVSDTLRQVLGAAVDVVCVQADVCRADLLVEVEAFASRRTDLFPLPLFPRKACA